MEQNIYQQNDATISQDIQDRKRQDIQDNESLLHSDLTSIIIGCCFDIMNEIGTGFLEKVYKNSLVVDLRSKGLNVQVEQKFNVNYRGKNVGVYIADIVVENSVIIELKCCDMLIGEHQAQLINYLKASGMLVGLLINFGRPKLVYKRVHHPNYRC